MYAHTMINNIFEKYSTISDVSPLRSYLLGSIFNVDKPMG